MEQRIKTSKAWGRGGVSCETEGSKVESMGKSIIDEHERGIPVVG
jgi:hypothetical protein